jgi:hypothetical protein
MMRHIPATLTLLAAASLSACHHEKSPAQQAAEDARAVAMVEAAQDVAPPPVPLDPQPITSADIEKNGFYGAGCTLVPAGQPGGDPILMADSKRATIKLAGKFVTYAADPGSAELGLGTRSHFVGKAQSLRLSRSTGNGTALGQESMRWQGTMTLSDAHDQLVYTASGDITCGS